MTTKEPIARIPFLDETIKLAREHVKPGDRPMAFIKTKDGKRIAIVFAVDKDQMDMSLYALMKKTNAEEIILQIEAWMVQSKNEEQKEKDLQIPVSINPRRVECILFNYFSKDVEAVHTIPFTLKNKKFVFGEEMPYWEIGGAGTRFNPFKKTPDELRGLLDKVEKDMTINDIKKKGRKEIMNLAYNCKIEIYRYEDQIYAEVFGVNGQSLINIGPRKNDEEFERKFEEVLQTIKGVSDDLKSRLEKKNEK